MPSQPRRVGILGSGNVGQALGRGFVRHGFDVMLGTRNPEKLAAWREERPGPRRVGSVAEAAHHGDPVVLATLGSGTEEALGLVGDGALDGKLVLDATNPLDFETDDAPGLTVGLSDSLGERVQRAIPRARVVKCFNTVPNSQMIDPSFKEGNPRMLICGESPEAKRATEALLRELGWPGTIDVGGIAAARWLEALVPLWVRTAKSLDAWDGAFRFVR